MCCNNLSVRRMFGFDTWLVRVPPLFLCQAAIVLQYILCPNNMYPSVFKEVLSYYTNLFYYAPCTKIILHSCTGPFKNFS